MSNKIIPKSEMDLLSAWLDRNGYPTAPRPELWGPLAERQAIAFLSDLETDSIQIAMPKYTGKPVSFEAGFKIDADGAPTAYGPNGKGLDYLVNAGSKGDWWGIATDATGQPFVQGPNDPAPGYYVSTTSLQDTRYPASDTRRYVNSEKIPGCVLPKSFMDKHGVKLGDLVLVERPVINLKCWTIFFDVGPRVGEGSISAARLLNINDNPKKGGLETGVRYTVFPKSGAGKILTAEQINVRAEELGLVA